MVDTADRSLIADAFGRPLRNLRLSVTDRCNLRCQYCMPEEEYVWLPREDLLTFEEIRELVDMFSELGVDKVRLTGGEPLLRKDLPTLVSMLADNSRLHDLAMTTNGILLTEHAQALYDAGLHRVTISLDTLRPERFKRLTRRDAHRKVLQGIQAAEQVGFTGLKLDTVVIRGTNEDELVDLIEYGKRVEGRGPIHRIYGRGRGYPMVYGQSGVACRNLGAVWSITMAQSRPFASSAPRQRNAFGSPMARCSASSPRPPRRSVGVATGVD